MEADVETASRGIGSGIALAVFIGASLAAGAIGSLFTFDGLSSWYGQLNKPSWNPPSWIFGPVWTFLYVAMGVAAWRVWRERGLEALPMGLFAVQLVLNAAWSWLFFGLRSLAAPFAEIIVLWLVIAAITVVFWQRDRFAGVLFLPYLAWTTFAAILNFTIMRMNP